MRCRCLANVPYASFCSTFMAAPLMPVIREDLNMTQTQVGNANSASVAGTVFFRILMGSLCDSVGPRKAYGVLMILVSVPCFAMSACLRYACQRVLALMIPRLAALTCSDGH